jgi:ribosome biogenesis protein MAK21
MKTVVVREIISLVLKPPAATSALSDGLAKGTGKHVRFADDKGSTKKPASAKKINGNLHARYYSMITLNQVVLTPSDRDVARQLLDVYFEMFKEVLGEGRGDEADEKCDKHDKDVKVDKAGRVMDGGRKGKRKGKKAGTEVKGAAGFTEVEDVNAKLISATLTGVNRALPFAKIDAADAKLVFIHVVARRRRD